MSVKVLVFRSTSSKVNKVYSCIIWWSSCLIGQSSLQGLQNCSKKSLLWHIGCYILCFIMTYRQSPFMHSIIWVTSKEVSHKHWLSILSMSELWWRAVDPMVWLGGLLTNSVLLNPMHPISLSVWDRWGIMIFIPCLTLYSFDLTDVTFMLYLVGSLSPCVKHV